jgi:hypothetical protein
VISFSAETALPAAFVYAFLLATGAARGAFYARNVEPSGALVLLYVGLLTAVGYWLSKDSKRHGVSWVWDMGFFLYIAWPLIMPYYLLKTRRAKAFLIGLAALGTYVVGYVVAALIFKA